MKGHQGWLPPQNCWKIFGLHLHDLCGKCFRQVYPSQQDWGIYRFLTSWNCVFYCCCCIELILNHFWVVLSPFWRRGRQYQRDLQWRLPTVASLSSGKRIWTNFHGFSKPVETQFESLLWILCRFPPARGCLEVIHCSQLQTVPWLPEHQGNHLHTGENNDKRKINHLKTE